MATDNLKTELEGIRDERRTQANTATRIGNALLGLLSRIDTALSLSTLKEYFLSRREDDRAEGEIGFVKGLWVKAKDLFYVNQNGEARLAQLVSDLLRSGAFVEAVGLSGRGFRMKTDGEGRATVQTDDLIVLGRMLVNTLEIREVSYIGGVYLLTPAGSRVAAVRTLWAKRIYEPQTKYWTDDEASVEDAVAVGYRLYVLADDGETGTMNYWQTGDQAFCQTFNVTESGTYTNAQNSHWWRLVVRTGTATAGENVLGDGKGYHYVDVADWSTVFLYNTAGAQVKNLTGGYTFAGKMAGTNTVPKAGDRMVCLGSQLVAERQAAVQISAEGVGSIDIFDGINNYATLEEHLVHSLNRRKVVMSANRFEWKTYNGESRPPSVYRGEWYKGAVSQWGDEWSHEGGRWLCILPPGTKTSAGEGLTDEAPGTTAAWWMDLRGPKGESTESWELRAWPECVVLNTANLYQTTDSIMVEAWHTDGTGRQEHLQTIPGGLRLMRNMVAADGSENGNTDRSSEYTGGRLEQKCMTQGMQKYDYYLFELQRMVVTPAESEEDDDVVSYDPLAQLSVPIIKVADGSSVVAQYAATDVPTSDSQIHATFQAGDLFMRMRLTSESFSGRVDAMHPWMRIVGEEGAAGPGSDYKDFKFGWSVQETTASNTTAPTLLGGTDWTDAPPKDPSTGPDIYYLWMKITPMRWNAALKGWTPGTATYQRIKGDQGPEGEQGDAGENGVAVTVTPSSLIFEEELDSAGNRNIDTTKWGNSADIVMRDGAENVSYGVFTTATKTVQGCTATLARAYVSGTGYVIRVTIDGVTKSGGNYVQSGWVDVVMPFGGKTYRARLNFYVNRLGTWKQTVLGDVESTLATKEYTWRDGNGVLQSSTVGEYMRSSSANISRLSEDVKELADTVADFEGGVKKIVDLTGLDPNRFFPVLVTLPNSPDRVRIRVVRPLTADYNPGQGEVTVASHSYMNHKLGFSMVLEWSTSGCGWGSQAVPDRWSPTDTYRKIYAFGEYWVKAGQHTAGNIGQAASLSKEYCYVRGGSRYLVMTDCAESSVELFAQGYSYMWHDSSNAEQVVLPIIAAEDLLVPEADNHTSTEIRQTTRSISLSVESGTKEGYEQLLKGAELLTAADKAQWSMPKGVTGQAVYGGLPCVTGMDAVGVDPCEVLQQRVFLQPDTWYTLSFYARRERYIQPYLESSYGTTVGSGGWQRNVYLRRGRYILAARGYVNSGTLYISIKDSNGNVIGKRWSYASSTTAVFPDIVNSDQTENSVYVSSEGVYKIVAECSGTAYLYWMQLGMDYFLHTYIYGGGAAIANVVEGCQSDGMAGEAASDNHKVWLLSEQWERHTYTFKTASALPSAVYLLFRLRYAGPRVHIGMPRLELGKEAHGFYDASRGLKRTGIDITNGMITAQTDNFQVVNTSGTKTFGVDKDGNLFSLGDASFGGTVRAKNLYHGVCVAGSYEYYYCSGEFMREFDDRSYIGKFKAGSYYTEEEIRRLSGDDIGGEATGMRACSYSADIVIVPNRQNNSNTRYVMLPAAKDFGGKIVEVYDNGYTNSGTMGDIVVQAVDGGDFGSGIWTSGVQRLSDRATLVPGEKAKFYSIYDQNKWWWLKIEG